MPVNLVHESDLIPAPNTHIDPDPKGGSEVVPAHIYTERSGLTTGPGALDSPAFRAAMHISGRFGRKKW